jgi:hypothetical protein
MKNLLYKNINKGDFIYKRFHKVINVSDMDDLQWFALSMDYGSDDTYGPIIYTYNFKEKPKLIDIGKMKNRIFIENIINLETNSAKFKFSSDPNNQYSGGGYNSIYHSYLKKYFGDEFDGTIIIEEEVDNEELEGPTEIVLWKNFNKLIKKL